MSLAPFAMTCMVHGKPLDTYEASGTNLLFPVWDSMRLSNFSTQENGIFKYATVMCRLLESSPSYFDKGDRRCPGNVLLRTLQKASDEFELSFLLGFEVEFVLTRRDAHSNVEAIEMSAGRNAVAGCQVPGFQCVEQSVRELEAIGIPV